MGDYYFLEGGGFGTTQGYVAYLVMTHGITQTHSFRMAIALRRVVRIVHIAHSTIESLEDLTVSLSEKTCPSRHF